MSYDEQPNGDIHGECALEIKTLNTRIAELEQQNENAKGLLCDAAKLANDYIALDSYSTCLREQLEAALKDAERYRWLRDRMQIRFMESVSGDKRAAFAMRIGHSFCDSTLDPARGWTDPKYFVAQQNRVNAAIDAAIEASKAGKEQP